MKFVWRDMVIQMSPVPQFNEKLNVIRNSKGDASYGTLLEEK